MAEPTIIQIKVDKAQLDLIDKELTRLYAVIAGTDENMRIWAAKRIEIIQDDLTILRRLGTNIPTSSSSDSESKVG